MLKVNSRGTASRDGIGTGSNIYPLRTSGVLTRRLFTNLPVSPHPTFSNFLQPLCPRMRYHRHMSIEITFRIDGKLQLCEWYKKSTLLVLMNVPFCNLFSDVSSCLTGTGNTTDGGACVLIGETPRTWHAARQHCISNGGDLLSLNNKTLINDIWRLMKRTNETMWKRHWVGATSVRWTWVTGTDK